MPVLTSLRMLLCTCALGVLFPGMAIAARNDGTDPSLTILKDEQHFIVQKDGSYVETTEYISQINEERAVKRHAQRQFSFNRTLETLDVIEAYTEKADGRKIPVKPDQIKLQQEPASQGAAMFQDIQVKVVVFPDVAVGDTLYSKVRRTRSKAWLEGYFSDRSVPSFYPTRHFTLIYDMPADFAVQVEAVGFQATPPQRVGERIVYRWDEQPADNARIEHGSVNYMDYGRRLIVSTFPDYKSLGLAYQKEAAKASMVNDKISAQAHVLTQGLSDPRSKALAIYDWVRKNIRYVAIYIGNGGLVPHDAAVIMDNRYGDCKDHVTLMEALLSAAGIDSTPALISSGNAFRLSTVASVGEFNHAITYIPSLDLFLDSTAENVAGGYLPPSDMDKTVVLTKTGALKKTPVHQQGGVRNTFEVQLAADGSATFRFVRNNLGWIEEPVRHEHRNWRKTDQDLFVENILKSYGMKGSGTVNLNVSAPGGPGYAYQLAGRAEDWAYLPNTVGIATNSSLWSGLAQQVFSMTSEAERTQDFICPEEDISEQAEYQFPEGAQMLYVPKNIEIDTPFLHYHARYTQKGRNIQIQRTLKSGKPDSRVCSAAEYPAIQATIKSMVRDLRSQFIVQVQ